MKPVALALVVVAGGDRCRLHLLPPKSRISHVLKTASWDRYRNERGGLGPLCCQTKLATLSEGPGFVAIVLRVVNLPATPMTKTRGVFGCLTTDFVGSHSNSVTVV